MRPSLVANRGAGGTVPKRFGYAARPARATWPATGLALVVLAVVLGSVLPIFSGSLQALVISEISYHSEAVDDQADEFIELYNENLDPFDLSGYTICDGVDFTFPPGTWLDGHTFIVVCGDEDAIRSKYGIENTVGNWFGSLDNSGERIRVCSTGGSVVTEVRYNDRGKWPGGADGTGHTLALRNPFVDPSDADSWRLSGEKGGTPGEINNASFESGGGFMPPTGGIDSQGFILPWLVLGPYTGSACNIGTAALQADWLTEGSNGPVRQSDLEWRPAQEVDTRYATARSTGLHANAPFDIPTVQPYASFGDTIDFDGAVYPPSPDQVMAYAFIYVDNVTGSNRAVDIACASDDAIHVLVNGVSVGVADVCRGVGGSGQIQNRFPATLEPGKNLITVKVFEDGGGWAFRMRIEGRNTGSPITSNAILQFTTDVDAGLDFNGNGTPIEEPGEVPPDPPPPGEEPDATPVIINEGYFFTGGARWIELYNRSDSSVDLSGYHVTDDPSDLDRATIPGGTSLAAGAHMTLTDTELGLDFSVAQAGDRRFVALVHPDGDQVLDAHNFEAEFSGFSEARIPDGDTEFEGAADPTPDAANAMSVITDIVINEIMYHPLGDDSSKEYIELYNRGAAPVDLTGWSFTRGIRFDFPDGTSIGAGQFLVVAQDPGLVASIHGLPAGIVIGPEQDVDSLAAFGRLADSGERITLQDEMGRTADTVRYHDGGEWARWADGFGSSLELIDPMQDNRFGQSWDASDDSDKATAQEFSYIGRHGGGESELHVLLLNAGITLVDDISIVGGGSTNIDDELIADDETWRYFKGTQQPPAGWASRTFNDGSWLSGQTGIGYGDGDDTTVLGDMRDGYMSIFCRKTFTVSDPGDIDDLVLSITVDDGFYAYLNGTQVASHNVGGTSFNDPAPGAGEPELIERNLNDFKNLLVTGTNVLAVQVHNAGLSSSDLSFIPRLVSRTVIFGEGTEQVTNGTFDSNTNGWIIEGTHVRSGRTTQDAISGNGSLKIVASGRGDNKVNRLETPQSNGFGLGNLNTGEDLLISFKARWVVGSQGLLTHGYQHAMAKSHQLDVPENLGTPGRVNGVSERLAAQIGSANLGPVVRDVAQRPIVPGDGENVTVWAKVADADGIATVRLRYSLNNPTTSPSSRTMTHLGGGLYRGVIPGQPLGTKVVFWIETTDSTGEQGRYPVDVAERSHPLVLSSVGLHDRRYLIYRHTVELPSTPYHSYRFFLTDADESTLRNRQRLSNDRLWGTFVYGARDIYYESATRFGGSPFARGGVGGSYRVLMPRDKPLHDRQRKFTLDNHHGNGQNARERTSHYLTRYNQGASSAPFSDAQTMVRWQLNDATTQTIEQVWVPDAQFIDRWFPDDDDGAFYEMDDRFVINDGGGRDSNTNGTLRYPPSSPRSDGDGSNKENYRWFFNLRSKNGADDYQPLIDLARVLDPGATSTAAFDEAIWDIVNVEEMVRIMAIRQNTDDWDTWCGRRGKNCYFYQPVEDGRFNLLLQDAELTYGSTTSFLIPSSPSSAFNPSAFSEVNRMLNRPKIKRMYYAVLDKMVNGPDAFFTSDHLSAYMSRLQAIGMSNTGIGQPGGFIDQRANLIRPRISSVVSTTFRITTNGGNDFNTTDPTESLTGTAPVGACELLVNNELYPVTFTSMTAFRIDDIPTPPGANRLDILGFSLEGELVGSDSITITNTNVAWDPPVITSIDPTEAFAGQVVQIDGSEFHNGVRVFFGATEALEVDYDEGGPTPGRIFVTVPDGSGQVLLRVENIDGQSSNSLPFDFVSPPTQFIRGDINRDGRVDVSDPVRGLRHLFGPLTIDCQDAADVDDNEQLEVTDMIRILQFLFQSGAAPSDPHPSAGFDPSGDTLGCDA